MFRWDMLFKSMSKASLDIERKDLIRRKNVSNPKDLEIRSFQFQGSKWFGLYKRRGAK